MKRFNKKNCISKVRSVHRSRFGEVFTLVGTHAFDWSIITMVGGYLKATTYPDRESAVKRFNDLKLLNK